MLMIDRVARFWNIRPCHIDGSREPFGTAAYFAEVTKHKYAAEPHILNFADFKHWRGRRVLEIGPGIGTDAASFASAGALYTGLELSQTSLEICRKRFEIGRLQGRFYLGNAEKMSATIPPEPYDLIYSFGVIHHTPDPKKVFVEIKKYCSPTTELRIMLYSKWSGNVWRLIWSHTRGHFWRIGHALSRGAEAEADCPVVNAYSFREIRKLLSDFDIIEMVKTHFLPYAPYDLDSGTTIPFVGRSFRRYPRWLRHFLEKTFGWHTLVIARKKTS